MCCCCGMKIFSSIANITLFALLTFTGVVPNMLFYTCPCETHSRMEGKNMFAVHNALTVGCTGVWLGGMWEESCVRIRNEKPVQLPRICFSIFKIFATLFLLQCFVCSLCFCWSARLLSSNNTSERTKTPLGALSLKGVISIFLFSSNTVLEEIALRSLRASLLRNPFLTPY